MVFVNLFLLLFYGKILLSAAIITTSAAIGLLRYGRRSDPRFMLIQRRSLLLNIFLYKEPLVVSGNLLSVWVWAFGLLLHMMLLLHWSCYSSFLDLENWKSACFHPNKGIFGLYPFFSKVVGFEI